jgi:hypothetical protein
VFGNESDWDSPADQHLIVRVYERRIGLAAPARVKRLSYGEQLLWIAKWYSTRSFAPEEVVSTGKSAERSARQKWINGLSPTCEQPAAWPPPPFVAWKVYKGLCQKMFQRARAFVQRQAPGVCTASSEVDHWGGAMDDWRAKADGWIRVDFKCVENNYTYLPKNHAWCDPRVSRCVKAR